MSDRVWFTPTKGLLVPNHETGDFFPPEGEPVLYTFYVARREMAGEGTIGPIPVKKRPALKPVLKSTPVAEKPVVTDQSVSD